jgi:hypothetical protein
MAAGFAPAGTLPAAMLPDAVSVADTVEAEVTYAPSMEARQEVLRRIEEAEAALRIAKAALLGGMGHNAPDTDAAPLTLEEHAQAADEIAELRREVEAPVLDRGSIGRALAGITAKAAKARAWLTERLSKLSGIAIGEVTKAAAKDAYDDHKTAVGAWLTHALERLVEAVKDLWP